MNVKVGSGIFSTLLIDGYGDFKLFLKIILPLSKPIIAVMVLFYPVGHWNSYFDALIYLDRDHLYLLQIILMEIFLQNQSAMENAVMDFEMVNQVMLAESMKYAVIVVASLPVIVLYPFVQKHFGKGAMIGSIKG